MLEVSTNLAGWAFEQNFWPFIWVNREWLNCSPRCFDSNHNLPGPENHKSLRWISAGYSSDIHRMRSDLWPMSVERLFQSMRWTLHLGNARLPLARSGARRSLSKNRRSSGGFPVEFRWISTWGVYDFPALIFLVSLNQIHDRHQIPKLCRVVHKWCFKA